MADSMQQPVDSTAQDTIAQALEQFRAGHFEQAADLARATLERSLEQSREHFARTTRALLVDPRLQPVFGTHERAANSLRFFLWLSKTVEHVLGSGHMLALFARVRITSALAAAGHDAHADANLSAFFSQIPRMPLVLQRATEEPTTEAPDERNTLCAHLAPILAYAREHGAEIAAAFDSLDDDRRFWMYLDGVVFDVPALLKRFSLPICVVMHTELFTGPQPCMGFRCETHGDAVLGVHPRHARNIPSLT